MWQFLPWLMLANLSAGVQGQLVYTELPQRIVNLNPLSTSFS